MEIIVLMVVAFVCYRWLKQRKRDRMQLIIESSSQSLQAYNDSFIGFRNIIYTEFYKQADASGAVLGSDDHVLFIRYLVEANEAAMAHFGIHHGLWEASNVLALKGLQISEAQARGLLAGFKLPPLRDVHTNESLDDIQGAGLVGYKEWLIGGDEVAIAKAGWLWKECSQLRSTSEQLAKIGVPLKF